MKINLKKIVFAFFISLLFVDASHAQTQFVKYKKYLIPIDVGPTGPCESTPIPSNVSVGDISNNDDGQARVFVTTDVGGGDPDDKQSLAHLLTFADELKIVGLATSGPQDGDASERLTPSQKKSTIIQYIDRYQIELFGRSNYPDLTSLRQHVYEGSESMIAPTNRSSQDTDASQAIIERARCTYHEDGGRPLYVLVWGTGTDVMRALADPNAQDIRKVVRVVSYSTPPFNNTGEQQNWINASAQQNIWLVDYPGLPRPLQNCNATQMNQLARNPLSRFTLNGIPFAKNQGGIVYNGTAGRSGNAEGSEVSCAPETRFTKLGDTITTMFALNPPAQRQAPHNGTTYGSYFLSSSPSTTRWRLRSVRNGDFKGFDDVYSTWINK